MSLRALVIGSGLGGLECGLLLAGKGFSVTVLEQGRQFGGCLQTFTRSGVRFDTGFHYVGGLEADGPLGTVFRQLGLSDLPWHRLDDDCVDEIRIGPDVFRIPAGYGPYVDYLAGLFPGQRRALEELVTLFRSVGEGIFSGTGTALAGQPAWDWLQRTVSDPLLRKVICGSFLRLPYDARTLSLYAFAQINHSYLRGAWRLRGGGSVLVDRLVALLEAAGGRLLSGKKAVRIKKDAVVCADGSVYPADVIISDVHPAVTASLLPPPPAVRHSYTDRLQALQDGCGVFTAQLRLRPGRVPYRNYNLFIHTPEADVWHPDFSRVENVMVHFAVPESGPWAESVDILTPVRLSQEGQNAGYRSFKENMSRCCIDFAGPAVAGLSDAVEAVYASTPRTWERYTGTRGGSAFGTVKTWDSPLTTVLSVKTPLKNVYLTGQNINLHGVLGVTMTALRTCAQILQEI